MFISFIGEFRGDFGAIGGAVSAVAAAHQARIANAIKASGAIIKVEPDEFEKILSKNQDALVVIAEGGFIGRDFRYLTTYKGLVFFTKSKTALLLDSRIEIIEAEKIWVP
ncbi:MAG: hypothetical protein HN590_14265 [Calditrichaeota bacterium]|nr:hypothetical protein [Calditrichota bacterium]